jgi:putative FmdB family regulatory protein
MPRNSTPKISTPKADQEDVMPIYFYTCRSCGDAFETPVPAFDAPACPVCGSQYLNQDLATADEETNGAGKRRACESDGTCGDCGDCDPSMIRPF